jgi:hypothetical protein
MRRLLLIAVTVLAPLAYAQAASVTTSTTTYTAAPAPQSAVTGSTQQSADPGNCGTPFEPKPCPPMPRVPLPYYTGDRGR